MNNVLRGIALPILIILAPFSGGHTLFASQAQPPVQTPPSSSSGRGGRSIFHMKDKEHAEALVKEANLFYQKSIEATDKQQVCDSLIVAGEKYAAAVVLGSQEVLKKLVHIGSELFGYGCFDAAKDLYIAAARAGSSEAQEKIDYLNNHRNPIEMHAYNGMHTVSLDFRTLSDCKGYIEEVRRCTKEQREALGASSRETKKA